MSNESAVLQTLFESWISLALEYAHGAPHLGGIYLYASSERGMRFANVYYDQGGTIKHPGDVQGIDGTRARIRHVQNLLVDELLSAEKELATINIPKPTEYRVHFDPPTRKLDVQLSREDIYGANSDRSPIHGIEYWLGDRAPTLY